MKHPKRLLLGAIISLATMNYVWAGTTPTIDPPTPPKAKVLVSQNLLISTGVAISKGGEVYVWGDRSNGLQGNGMSMVYPNTPPAKVTWLSDIETVTGGNYHLLALDKQGNVYGWGRNSYSQTGCPGAGQVMTPCRVMSFVKQIAAGSNFSIAMTKTGQVFTWGHNYAGQLGNGNTANSIQPVLVHLQGETARIIGSADEGAFAVTKEGHVWAWGNNEGSGLGFQGSNYGASRAIRVPTRVPELEIFADDIIQISGGKGWGEALLEDGTVIGWGTLAPLGVGVKTTALRSTQPRAIINNIQQLHARFASSTALTKDGKIYTWGHGTSTLSMIYGEVPSLRTPPWTSPEIVAIGGGRDHVFYQTKQDALYGVGNNSSYKLNQSLSGGVVEWPGAQISYPVFFYF